MPDFTVKSRRQLRAERGESTPPLSDEVYDLLIRHGVEPVVAAEVGAEIAVLNEQRSEAVKHHAYAELMLSELAALENFDGYQTYTVDTAERAEDGRMLTIFGTLERWIIDGPDRFKRTAVSPYVLGDPDA